MIGVVKVWPGRTRAGALIEGVTGVDRKDIVERAESIFRDEVLLFPNDRPIATFEAELDKWVGGTTPRVTFIPAPLKSNVL